MNNTKIKICGIKDTRLIDELSKLNIDFIGTVSYTHLTLPTKA